MKKSWSWRTKVKASEIGRRQEKEGWTRDRKMRVAEAAVLFRLAVNDIVVYASPFDGDSADFVVSKRNGPLLRLSVRWASLHHSKQGRPLMSLRTSGKNGMGRVSNVDIFAAYDPISDAVYVWRASELRGRSTVVSVHDSALERWDKISPPKLKKK